MLVIRTNEPMVGRRHGGKVGCSPCRCIEPSVQAWSNGPRGPGQMGKMVTADQPNAVIKWSSCRQCNARCYSSVSPKALTKEGFLFTEMFPLSIPLYVPSRETGKLPRLRLRTYDLYSSRASRSR